MAQEYINVFTFIFNPMFTMLLQCCAYAPQYRKIYCGELPVSVYQLQSSSHFLSFPSPFSFTHTCVHIHTHIHTYLGREVFQNGRTVDCRSSAYSTMTRGSVFQMPVNSANRELQ